MYISFSIIGANIRNTRRAAHLTQAQTAEKLGMSVLHYGRLERGERQPSIRQLAAVAHALNTSIESLLCGCCLCADDHAHIFEAAADQKPGTAEYALMLMDEYREQLQRYCDMLHVKENALR